MMHSIKRVLGFEKVKAEKKEVPIDVLSEKVKDYEKIKAEYPELNFEKLERLKKELRNKRTDLEEIRPKFKKEYEKSRNFEGKYAKIKRKLIAYIRELEKEIGKLETKIAADSEKIFVDPVKRVKEKYKHIPNVKKAKQMLKKMIEHTEKASYYGTQINRLRYTWGEGRTDYTNLLHLKNNLIHYLQYEIPESSVEKYEKELNKAKLKVIEMKKAKKEELELEDKYSISK